VKLEIDIDEPTNNTRGFQVFGRIPLCRALVNFKPLT